MKSVGLLLLGYLTIVVQSTIVPAELATPGQPFLPAITLVLIVRHVGPMMSAVLAAAMGLMLDGLSTERLGIQMVLALLLAWGLRCAGPFWQSRGVVFQVSMIVLTCAVWRFTSALAASVLAEKACDPAMLLIYASQDAAWTSLVALAGTVIVRGLLGSGRSPSRQRIPSNWAAGVG